MEVDDGQCNKLPRISRNGGAVNNEAPKMEYGVTGGVDLSGGVGRFYGWPSSRIVRVSRASGGKDRHSKVLTSKGLRDRRVRLSVNTAIQFYDLQDRLGYDQPSKAVEWLLKAAANSITELPPISPPFPDTPKQQMSDEKRSESVDNNGVVDPELDPDPNNYPPQQNAMKKSSACSSPSETTSKGSGLSLSRSDGPKRARNDSLHPISQATSFTELLSGRELHSAPMDYFGGIFGQPPVLSRQVIPATSPLFSMTENHHHQPELQHFSFVPDHLVVPVVNAAASNGGYNNGSSEYNLNFTISSSAANPLNRGTLQSNSSSSSPSLFPNGSPPGFFIGTMENHQQFLSQFYYGDSQANNNGGRYSGQKEKEKN